MNFPILWLVTMSSLTSQLICFIFRDITIAVFIRIHRLRHLSLHCIVSILLLLCHFNILLFGFEAQSIPLLGSFTEKLCLFQSLPLYLLLKADAYLLNIDGESTLWLLHLFDEGRALLDFLIHVERGLKLLIQVLVLILFDLIEVYIFRHYNYKFIHQPPPCPNWQCSLC